MANVQVNLYHPDVLERIAHELLQNFDIDPHCVDIVQLANNLGLNVFGFEFPDSSLSGFIRYENGQKNIYVNSSHAPVRQRFTIAHEIAHFILHKDLLDSEGGSALYRGKAFNEVENQANRLAAAILMDANTVNELYRTYRDSTFLARAFFVSNDAMNNRLIDLGLR